MRVNKKINTEEVKNDYSCPYCGETVKSELAYDNRIWECGTAVYFPSGTVIQSKKCKLTCSTRMNAEKNNILFNPEKLIGTVSICNRGRIGLIKKVSKTKRGYIWEGIGLYDSHPWQSKNPLPIAWSLDDYKQAKEMWIENIEKVQ